MASPLSSCSRVRCLRGLAPGPRGCFLKAERRFNSLSYDTGGVRRCELGNTDTGPLLRSEAAQRAAHPTAEPGLWLESWKAGFDLVSLVLGRQPKVWMKEDRLSHFVFSQNTSLSPGFLWGSSVPPSMRTVRDPLDKTQAPPLLR